MNVALHSTIQTNLTYRSLSRHAISISRKVCVIVSGKPAFTLFSHNDSPVIKEDILDASFFKDITHFVIDLRQNNLSIKIFCLVSLSLCSLSYENGASFSPNLCFKYMPVHIQHIFSFFFLPKFTMCSLDHAWLAEAYVSSHVSHLTNESGHQS